MKKRIGDILIEMGFIDQDQLQMALMETRKTGSMLGDVLLRMDWITEENLQMAIAVQSGAQILDIDQVVVDSDITQKIPVSFVTENFIFPFAIEAGVMQAATVNPFDVIAKDKLARLAGCPVNTYIAPKEWIAKAIELHYKTAQNIDDDIESITLIKDRQATVEEAQIIRLSNLIIEKGFVLGASDIHIVPDTHLVRIYFRIDGVLHQTYLFASNYHQALVTRFKIMADMDISNPNIPHDGRIKYQGDLGQFDIRVSTFPTQLGETVIMRLLIYHKVVGDIGKLGFEPDDLEVFKQGIHRPYGLILTTGPTGSGKTTTLYSALMTVNNPTINCMTIEDPIEYTIPTIRQTAVNPKAGLNFKNALRSAMRQDPDVILVGEIRDKETADLAMQAALTGHLVLSTLHTNDAASAINRLLDLDVNPNILASTLSLIVAQRLLRTLCPKCAQRQPITTAEQEIFTRHSITPPNEIAQPVGCETCFQSGYRGRIGIFEVLPVDRTIEQLIFSGALHSKIEDAAVQSGTSLMIQQALKKAANHFTSIEEISRVVVDYA
jgi:type IV pilus assembly protein PilB